MVITYHGAAFCKVSQGDTTVAFGSPGKKGLFIRKSGQEPFLIEGPGEYEVGGITVRGFANELYSLIWDDISFCHSGMVVRAELPPEALESIGDVDVLFVYLDEVEGLNAKDAHKLAKQLEPKIIIPLSGAKGSNELRAFLKESVSLPTRLKSLPSKSATLRGGMGPLSCLKRHERKNHIYRKFALQARAGAQAHCRGAYHLPYAYYCGALGD